ncbi:MAG: DUF3800 domain-containing protein [Bacteroidetes bacterium]|nr:DUF3800 domain-containing protein [Bacteroidota bacterium]MBX7046115.1 DUF3800 domain-containing protein [Ignavibacteria bacterium]
MQIKSIDRKLINLYCDESCHLANDGHPFMLIGYIGVNYHQKDTHKSLIKHIKNINKFNGEIKWSKVSSSKYDFYLELLDYFFASDMFFRAVVIDKDKIKTEFFANDYNKFYYKMYYKLINHKINIFNNYNVYLDIKDTLSSYRVRRLKEVLNTQFEVIKNLQNIQSRESVFLQLADFILGAISYRLRNLNKVKAKNSLINHIEKNSGYKISNSNVDETNKYHLHFIELN